jgi:hypothetical protein
MKIPKVVKANMSANWLVVSKIYGSVKEELDVIGIVMLV